MKTSAILFVLLTGGSVSVSAQTFASVSTRPVTEGMETRDVVHESIMGGEETTQATFPGGTKALAKYLKQEFRMTEFARENGLEGMIIIRCTIGTDGEVSGATVIESVHPVIDAEALSVVEKMPAWSPAIQNGRFTQAKVEIPFHLRLR